MYVCVEGGGGGGGRIPVPSSGALSRSFFQELQPQNGLFQQPETTTYGTKPRKKNTAQFFFNPNIICIYRCIILCYYLG